MKQIQAVGRLDALPPRRVVPSRHADVIAHRRGPSGKGQSVCHRAPGIVAVLIVALLAASCGAATSTTAPPPPTFRAIPEPIYQTSTPVPTAAPTKAESGLVASMTGRYDDCRLNEAPTGTMVANVACTTADGVTVIGSQYATTAAVTAAFKAQAKAKKGTRCSAGAYLGDYKVAKKTTGQLGCNGTGETIVWTVPKLRLLLTSTGLSMPELYSWWQHAWTTGSVTSAATTGEKAVPIPVEPTDAPADEPTDAPPDEPSPADVYPASPAGIRFKQTWTTAYSATTCGDWNYSMTPEQRWTMAADLLFAVRGVNQLPPDDLSTEFGSAISFDCTATDDVTVIEIAAALYTLAPDAYGP
jgi:hypothetical protein